MADIRPQRALEIDERPGFQRGNWIAERIAWGACALLVAAALCGAFGDGPLSRRQAASGELRISYDAVLRHGSLCQLVAEWTATDTDSSLGLSQSLLNNWRIQHIEPAPRAQLLRAFGCEMRFATVAGERVRVEFDLRPEAAGFVDGWIEIRDVEVVKIGQTVLP